jgi:hypothetical protein
MFCLETDDARFTVGLERIFYTSWGWSFAPLMAADRLALVRWWSSSRHHLQTDDYCRLLWRQERTRSKDRSLGSLLLSVSGYNVLLSKWECVVMGNCMNVLKRVIECARCCDHSIISVVWDCITMSGKHLWDLSYNATGKEKVQCISL